MYNQKQVSEIVKSALGINLQDYKQTGMEMFFVDTAKCTASWMTRNANPQAPEWLSGDLNTAFTKAEAQQDGSVVLEWDGGLYSLNGAKRRTYKTRTILAFVNGVLTRQNWSELADVVISQNVAKNTAAIATARTKWNLQDATEADVIHAMATSLWRYKFAPSIAPELSIEITTTPNGDKLDVAGKLFRKGVEIDPIRCRWEVWPVDPAFAASAQFPVEQSFTITNDLTDRENYAVMAADQVKLRAMLTTTEDDGDHVSVMTEKVVPLGFAVKQYF